MSKHTPGPWAVDPSIDNGVAHEVLRADGDLIAQIAIQTPSVWDDEEGIANARLIAAAPDLLAFAQEFLADYQSEDGMDSMKRYAAKAYAAIKKATGDTE